MCLRLYESHKAQGGHKKIYCSINNYNINEIMVVTRRTKTVGTTQVNHVNPYLLINVLLLQ